MGQTVSHQLARVESSSNSTPSDEGPSPGQGGLFLSRQLDGGDIPSQARRHSLAGTSLPNDQNFEVGGATTSHVNFETHCGRTECTGRFGLKGGPSAAGRVEVDQPSVKLAAADHPLPSSDARTICQSLEPSAREVRVPLRGPGGSTSGCHSEPVAIGGDLRISPKLSDGPGPSSAATGRVFEYPSRALVVSLHVKANLAFPLDRPLLCQPHWEQTQMPPSLSNLRVISIVQNG